MNLYEAIYSRRSTRRFLNKDIPKEDVLEIIDAGIHAPSACNIHGWHFIVINDPKTKKEIIDGGGASFIKNSPLGILVLYNNQTDNVEYMDYVQSAAACIQNMLLMAHSLGVGACWICHLPRKSELRKMLDIPKHYDPIAYVALGYPDKSIKVCKRKYKAYELISYNQYKHNTEPASVPNLWIKRMMRKIYYYLPYRKLINNRINKRFEKRFDDDK